MLANVLDDGKEDDYDNYNFFVKNGQGKTYMSMYNQDNQIVLSQKPSLGENTIKV